MKKIISLVSLTLLLFSSVSVASDIDWIQKTPMPTKVGAFGYAVVDSKIYIIGGDSSGSSMNTVQRYNPTTDTWEEDINHGGTLAPLPQARAVLFCGVINGKIHAMGGWENGTYRGDHFIYDPDINSWSIGPSIPQYPIGQFAGTVNNEIYVFGGWWGSYQDSVYQYSDDTGWSSKNSMPTARAHGTTVAYDGNIYVIGGEDGQPAQRIRLDLVEMYDPASDSWTTGLAPMPSPEHWLGSSGSPESNGIFYIIGPGNTVYSYDAHIDSWETLEPLPNSAIGIDFINGSLYAIGPEDTLMGIPSTIPIINPGIDDPAPEQGETVCVQVDIADVTDLYAASFDLIYDPSVLDYTGITEGTFLNENGLIATTLQASPLGGDENTGQIVVGVSRLGDVDGASGSGTLATLCFTVIGPYCSASDITFGGTTLERPEMGSEIGGIWNTSTVSVTLSAPTNPVTSDPGLHNRIDICWDELPGVTSYEIYRSDNPGGPYAKIGETNSLCYQDSDCIIPDLNYYYRVRAVTDDIDCFSEYSEEVIGVAAGLSGDINNDGRVNGRDLSILSRAFGTSCSEPNFNCLADLNRDCIIDGDDLSILASNFGMML